MFKLLETIKLPIYRKQSLKIENFGKNPENQSIRDSEIQNPTKSTSKNLICKIANTLLTIANIFVALSSFHSCYGRQCTQSTKKKKHAKKCCYRSGKRDIPSSSLITVIRCCSPPSNANYAFSLAERHACQTTYLNEQCDAR